MNPGGVELKERIHEIFPGARHSRKSIGQFKMTGGCDDSVAFTGESKLLHRHLKASLCNADLFFGTGEG